MQPDSGELARVTTLVGLLRHRSATQPDRVLYTFLANGVTESESWTFGDLDRRARQIAAALQAACLEGARAMIVGPTCGDYIAAFFGCLYAGVVAVPQPAGRRDRDIARLAAVAADARAAAVILTGDEADAVERHARRLPTGLRCLSAARCDGSPDEWREPPIDADDLAYLQYTSGSTSTPKGVEIRHRNVMANERGIQEVFEQDEHSVVVGWLPLYHDMGLVGTVLQPLYSGGRAILFSPAAFLQKPVRWLDAISRYRATTSGAPDFAFDLCARQVSAEEKTRLDLRSWAVAFNGSEPVRSRTLTDFAAAFAACGFSPDAFLPCFGLAEATLLVSGARTRSTVACEPADGAGAGCVVSCGRPAPGVEVVVVDPETLEPQRPGHIGEICVAGPGVADGYWRRRRGGTFNVRVPGRPEPTFLRTGDLGYLRDGNLFVTGRIKDLIIVRGRNLYAHDIEYTVSRAHPAAAAGRAAVFGVASGGGERLVAVQELRRGAEYTPAIAAAIRRAVADGHDAAVDEIAIVKWGVIPRTTSGKTQRALCRELFLRGALDVVARDERPQARATAGATTGWHTVQGAPADERRELAVAFVRERVVETLAIDPDALLDHQPLAHAGLDSMGAVDLQRRIEDAAGVTLSSALWIGDETVATVAERLLTGTTMAPESSVPAAARAPDGAPEAPLSVGQRALWYVERIAGQPGLFNVSVAARITGPCSADRLERAFQALVDRHAALRANIVERQGTPVSVVHRARVFTLDRHDVAGWSDEQIAALLRERSTQPFDLARDLLFRAHLLCRSPSESVLSIVVHHQVADFWSLAVMFRELAALVTGAALPEPPRFQYADFVRWQQDLLDGARGEDLRRFWTGALQPLPPPIDLPTERPRGRVQTYRAGARPFHIPRAVVEALAGAGRAEGATFFVCLCAVFEALLHRYAGSTRFVHGTLSDGRPHRHWHDVVGYFVNPVVLAAAVDPQMRFVDLLRSVRQRTRDALQHRHLPFPVLAELVATRRDHSRPPVVSTMFAFQSAPGPFGAALAPFAAGVAGATLEIGGSTWESVPIERPFSEFELMVTCAEASDGVRGTVQFNADLFAPSTIEDFADAFARLADRFGRDPSLAIDLPLVDGGVRTGTSAPIPDDAVHRMFERTCRTRPDARAVVFEDREWSFGEVNHGANRLARRLLAASTGLERMVGIFLPRCGEIPVAMLAVLKCGAAYVPLDPSSPPDRLAQVVTDARLSTIVTTRELAPRLAWTGTTVVCLEDGVDGEATDLDVAVHPDNAAYLLYTSGSTGRPKGVVITHRNLANLFVGLDERIGCGPGDVMLAVSAITFDISALELLWTLTRGCAVVIAGALELASPKLRAARPRRPLDWSLFYFAQNTSAAPAADRYRLLLEGARFAEAHGFTAVWTPERHFDAFGGLYPNPALTSAALASITKRIGLRAGSVVLPLHNPIRVAEEWAVVDNLSGGRVAVAFASGWHADDFALAPDAYATRKQRTYEGIETVRRLWRGESVTVRGGGGNEIAVRIFPAPIQPELPVWVTAAGAEDTFRTAGRIGANVLTHLLGQTLDDVGRSIGVYRAARADAGHDPTGGTVTLMVHAFVGADDDRVRRLVREPMKRYLQGAIGLIGKYARSMNMSFDPAALSDDDREALIEHAFERYYAESSLLGSSVRCGAMADRFVEAGVDEVACLIDFGVDDGEVLAALPALNELRRAHAASAAKRTYGIAEQAGRFRPTLLQCTPSLLQVLLSDAETRAALAGFEKVLIGGEALPPPLVQRVRAATAARLFNMYGPTETTVWSTVDSLGSAADVRLGDPIANTRVYVLDDAGWPVPRGLVGELWIAGAGLARGYHDRPALTAERFVPHPFADAPGERMYRTGDLVKVHGDGTIEWIGRRDQQVKVRGHRIELGDIEAALLRVPGVHEAAVVAAAHNGAVDVRAFVVADRAVGERQLRDGLENLLPSYMLPQTLVRLGALPRNASGKIDRASLSAQPPAAAPQPPATAPQPLARPRTALERRILAVWRAALRRDDVEADDNFFDVGGHSLLMAQVHSELQGMFDREWPLVRMLEYPTVAALARFLDAADPGEIPDDARRRSASRRSALLSRQAIGAGAGPSTPARP